VSFITAYDGGSDITSYEYSLDGGANWATTTATSASPTFTLTGLTNGHSYTPIVRAVSVAGSGEPSTSLLSAIPATVPDAPSGFTVVYGEGSVTISFIEGDPGGSPATGFEYTLDGGSTWVHRIAASTAEPLVLNNLAAGETVHVHLRETNSVGPGLSSQEVVLNVPVPRVAMAVTALALGAGTLVEGTGFAALSDIRIVMHSTPVELGIVRSDINGTFSTHISIPANAETGDHHLEFSYVGSGNEADSIPFSVVAPILAVHQLANTGTRPGALEGILAASLALLALGIVLTQIRRRTSRTGALSVSITVVWLYMQILRILAIARN
jgi:hypothetical protein